MTGGFRAARSFSSTEGHMADTDTPESNISAAPLAAKPDKGKVRLELLRAYWDENAERIDEGTIFDCDAVSAVDLVEKGIAKKAGA